MSNMQITGIALWAAAALSAGTAPNYNGQWLLGVVFFVVGGVLLAVSKVREARNRK